MNHGFPTAAIRFFGLLIFVTVSCTNRLVASENAQGGTDTEVSSDISDAGELDTERPDIYPQYRYAPAHRGLSPSRTRISADFILRWQTEPLGIGVYSASKSSPSVDTDKIFVGVDDGRLIALNRTDGILVWEYKTHRYYTELDVEGGSHLGIHGSPAFDDKNVYIGDYDGFLYAVDKRTGTLVWANQLGGSIGASPMLHDGFVYMAVEYPDPNGKVFIVDAASGNEVWSTEYLGHHPHSSVSLDEKTGRFFVGANNGSLFCFDIVDRQLKWVFETGGEIKSTPAVANGTVFFTSWDQRLHAVSVEDGRERYSFLTADVTMSSPSVYENRVYFGSHDSRLYALNAAVGDMVWRFDAIGPILSSPAIIQDSRIIVVGSRDRYLYLLNMDDGTLVRSFALPGGVSSVPVAVGDSLFVNDDTGTVSCFFDPE